MGRLDVRVIDGKEEPPSPDWGPKERARWNSHKFAPVVAGSEVFRVGLADDLE